MPKDFLSNLQREAPIRKRRQGSAVVAQKACSRLCQDLTTNLNVCGFGKGVFLTVYQEAFICNGVQWCSKKHVLHTVMLNASGNSVDIQ